MATAYLPSEYVFTSNPVPIKITGLTTGQKIKVVISDYISGIYLMTLYYYERLNEANFDLSGVLNDMTAKYFYDYADTVATINEGKAYRQLRVKITNVVGTVTYSDSVFICVFGGKQIGDAKEYRCGNYGTGNWLIEHEKIEYYTGSPVMLSFLSAFTIVAAGNPVNVTIRVKKQSAGSFVYQSFPVTINRGRSVQNINLLPIFNALTSTGGVKWYEIEIMYGNPLSSIVKPIRIYNKGNIYQYSDVQLFRWLNKLGGWEYAYLYDGSESIAVGTETANIFLDSIEPIGNRYRSTHEVRTKTSRKTKKFGTAPIDYDTWVGHSGISESIAVQTWDKNTGLWLNVECVDSSFSWNNRNTLNEFEATVLFPQSFTQKR